MIINLKDFMYCAALTAFTLGATSCSNDEETSTDKTPREIEVKVGINQNNMSRAGITAKSFTNGESIGLYVYKGTGIDNVVENTYPQQGKHRLKNAHYKKNGGLWSTGTPGTGVILSDEIGIAYAYYPYAATNNDVEGTLIPIKVHASQGTGLSDGTKNVAQQSDYMWATPVPKMSNATTTATFTMNHALAMVSFKFAKGDYPGAAVINSIKLQNKASKGNIKSGDATMNIGTGALTIPGEAAKNGITITPGEELCTGSKVARMLVFPVSTTMTAGDVEAQITMDGKTYTIPLPAPEKANTYVAGKNYQYTFTLTGKGFGGIKPGDDSWKNDVLVEIVSWEDIDGGNSNVETPDDIPVHSGD